MGYRNFSGIFCGRKHYRNHRRQLVEEILMGHSSQLVPLREKVSGREWVIEGVSSNRDGEGQEELKKRSREGE